MSDYQVAIEWLEQTRAALESDEFSEYYLTTRFVGDLITIAIQWLQEPEGDRNEVTVTWENTDDCPMAICSGCGKNLATYGWFDEPTSSPEKYCQYCGGRIVEEVVSDEVYDDDEEEEDEEE